MRLKADLTLFLIAVIWGSAFAAQRVAGQLGSVYFFNAARFLLASLVVLPFAIRAAKTVPRATEAKTAQWLWMAAAGVVLFAAAALQQIGLLSTTAANAGFITSLYVVLVPVALFFFWRERPHWLAILGVMLATAGAFLLSSGGSALKLQTGDFFELLGAILWTAHVILIGKVASRFEPMAFSMGQLFICGILNSVLGLLLERPDAAQVRMLVVPVLYTAVFSLGMGYTLQVWAQRHTPPADAALILSLESVFAALAGWVVLGETLLPVQIAGCVLIFAAILFSQARQRVSV